MKLSFPVDYTLISDTGQSLEAHIVGRDAASVRFELSDGKMYAYQMSKLSPESQAFLKLFSANLSDASLPNPEADTAKKSATQQFAALQSKLSALIQTDSNQMSTASKSVPSTPSSRGIAYADNTVSFVASAASQTTVADPDNDPRYDSNRNEIENVCKQLNPLVDSKPRQGNEHLAQNSWSHVMLLIKDDDELRIEMTNPNQIRLSAEAQELRRNQADVVKSLREIYNYIGEYSPPAPASP